MKQIKVIALGLMFVLGLNACNQTKETTSTTDPTTTANATTDSNTPPANTNQQIAAIKFEAPEYDFGTVEKGKELKHTFKFTNTGTVPLTIQEVKPSCGCTVAEYTKTPIEPNAQGEITAKFNPSSEGIQHKTITVLANIEGGQTELKFTANVEPESNGPVKK